MKRNVNSLIFGVLFVFFDSGLVYAQDANFIAKNIVSSTEALPGVLAALCYLSGLIIAITAIFKTIDHVNNPSQTPISIAVVRYLIGGALFGLPIIAEAIYTTINGPAAAADFSPGADSVGVLFDWMQKVQGLASGSSTDNDNINAIMEKMIISFDQMPALVSAVAYLLGLVIAVSALYKTRDHVEDPSRVPLKDAVIRYLTAGALFALPAVFQAMYESIMATGSGTMGWLSSVITAVSFVYSSETNAQECSAAIGAANPTLGDVICTSFINTSSFPFFLNGTAYMMGLVLGVWGVLKVRDHVIDPSRIQLSEGVMRMIAGGCFFSLPYMIATLKNSFLTSGLWAFSSGNAGSNTGFNTSITKSSCGTTNSLDEMMGCFMLDMLGPAHVALNFFCFVAGTIFIMIGISRLIKSSQEGARGPGGIGTFTTFVIGGMLISATSILRAFSASFFDDTVSYTMASIQHAAGLTSAEEQAIHNLVTAVLQFMIVLGMISFVRGMFIIRDVAEGKGNASLMAGVTHLIGGALAVNLGPLLNAIQHTLGISSFGIAFS